MAVQSQPSQVTLEMLKVLGLEDENIFDINISIKSDDVIIVTVQKYATEKEMIGIATVLTDYELVEKVKM